MIRVQVRRQGGAAIMTIPANLLKLIHAEIGATMQLDVVGGALVARPEGPSPGRRYSVEELLEGVTPEMLQGLAEETAWFGDGAPQGRELA